MYHTCIYIYIYVLLGWLGWTRLAQITLNYINTAKAFVLVHRTMKLFQGS